jgi:hypothetical protein
MAIRNILQKFGIFYDQLLHYVFIWYVFGIMHHLKIWQPWLVWTDNRVTRLASEKTPKM